MFYMFKLTLPHGGGEDGTSYGDDDSMHKV